MIEFEVVPFRLGGAASKPLGDEVLPSYVRLIELIVGHETAVFVESEEPTVALTVEQTSTDPASVGVELRKALAKIEPARVAVLDLTSVDSQQLPDVDQIRGAVYVYLANAIAAFLGEVQVDRQDLRLLVLLPETPPPEDAAALALQPYLDSGELVLVDVNGASAGKHAPIAAATLSSAISLARRDRLELLEAKLIVRRGWFEHGSEDEPGFVRFHYDGALCQREIQELIAEYIADLDSPPHILIFDTSVTDWLESPVRAVATDLGMAAASVQDAEDAVESQAHVVPGVLTVLVIVPMVHTGRSLLTLWARLVKHAEVQLVTPLAILSTAGKSPRLGSRTLVDSAGKPAVDVQYVLRVEQEDIPERSPGCDPVHLGIPRSVRRQEPQLGLATYEFWDIVTQCGWRPEVDVPTWRPSAGAVPDLAEALRRYGAWFAAKLAEMVRRDTRLLASDTLYVAPAGEEASALLGRHLELTIGAQVVHVPRDVIDRLVRSPDLAADDVKGIVRADTRSWRRHLSSARTDIVVVFDEFISTGGTVRALIRLLQSMGFAVASVAALVDFRPDEDRFGVPVRSLYSWRRPEPAG